MTTIIIEWEKVDLKDFLNGVVKNIDNKLSVRPAEYGLYQIYSTHLIYGPNSLVYIGKAFDQPILNRITSHNEYWLNFESEDVNVHIGKFITNKDIDAPTVNDKWKEHVNDAEKLLIYNCAPAYNSANIVDHGLGDKEVIVFNYGKRGQLPIEVSTLYDNSIYWHKANGGKKEIEKQWKYFDELYNESNK